MRRRSVLLAIEISVPCLLLAAWWTSSSQSESLYLPPLRDILGSFADLWLFDRVPSDLLPSLGRLAAGLSTAVALGILLGLVLGSITVLRRAFTPVIEFLRALPSPVIIPFGILTLGTGTSMKIFVIALGSLWPVLLNTVDGVRSTDPTLLDTSRVYGLRSSTHLTKVLLPAASPQIFAGIRTALSIGIILMVVSEMVASTNGVGFSVLESQRSFAISDMWAGIILLGIIGYVVNLLFSLVERQVLHWHRGLTARDVQGSGPIRLSRLPVATARATRRSNA